MKERRGGVYWEPRRKVWIARISFTDPSGRRRERKKQVETRTAGRQLLKHWVRQLAESGGDRFTDGASMTFRKLADTYTKRKLQPPVIKGAVRISGMRTWKTQRGFLRELVAYFGNRRVVQITHSDLEQYKNDRLKVKTYRGDERSLAHVHRELSLMRAIFNFARRNGWITRSPFEAGPAIIKHADEPKRERILTREEESRLLAACTGKRAHLKPLLILLLDTAVRRGEALSLKWSDVNFEEGLISIRAEQTKALRARTIGITARLRLELERLASESSESEFVFGKRFDPKTAFASACRAAAIDDFRIHDCRHSAVSRWCNEGGISIAEAMRLAGWSTPNVAYRYMNINESTARRAAEATDRLNEQAHQAGEFVN